MRLSFIAVRLNMLGGNPSKHQLAITSASAFVIRLALRVITGCRLQSQPVIISPQLPTPASAITICNHSPQFVIAAWRRLSVVAIQACNQPVITPSRAATKQHVSSLESSVRRLLE
jgi:hypothetical protein